MYKSQLFVGDIQPSEEFFNEVKNGSKTNKGEGGLWTSSYINVEEGSDWIQWCLRESFRTPDNEAWKAWLLFPKEEAKIFTIDNIEDGKYIFDKYGYKSIEGVNMISIDFEKLKVDYDALHLTERGQAETRFTCLTNGDSIGLNNFYGWDCESTYWFRYKFDHIEPIELNIINPDL